MICLEMPLHAGGMSPPGHLHRTRRKDQPNRKSRTAASPYKDDTLTNPALHSTLAPFPHSSTPHSQTRARRSPCSSMPSQRSPRLLCRTPMANGSRRMLLWRPESGYAPIGQSTLCGRCCRRRRGSKVFLRWRGKIR